MKATLSFGTDNSKDRSFFAAGFLAVNRARTKLTYFLPSSICSGVSSNLARYIKMSFSKVFFGGKTFKIVSSVVNLVAVNVMDLFQRVKTFQPASRYNSVHKAFPTQHKVSLRMLVGSVGMQISKNFSAARDGVKMVKHTVFNTVHRKANHVVPFWVIAKTSSYH